MYSLGIPSNCQRCSEPSRSMITSMFNTQWICTACKEKEMKHPKYEEAERREREECSKGNRNFEGIGLED